MKCVSLLFVWLGLFLVATGRTTADDHKPVEPTAEELESVKAAFEKLDGKHYPETDPVTKQTRHVFILSSSGTSNATLQKLPNVPFPFGLRLPFTEVTDAGLKHLKKFDHLVDLDCVGSKVTDIGVKELKELKRLTYLSLERTQVTDAGLNELKGIKRLTFLSLKDTIVTDVGVKQLSELNNLTSLSLYNTKVTDAGLVELKNLKNLAYLNLCSTVVTGMGLKELNGLKKLATIELDNTQLTDAVLRALRETDLFFALTNATGKDGKRVSSSVDITTLNLGSANITDTGLEELKGLESVDLL